MSSVIHELIELRTNDATKVVRLAQIEKFRNGSGYSCELTIMSGGFACTRPFYFDDVSLSTALQDLHKMMGGTPGSAIIKGQWEDDFLEIRSNAMGHVFVSGEIIEHSEYDQRLRFSFRTDQTILAPLIKELKVLQDA